MKPPNFIKMYWAFFAILVIIFLGVYIRTLDYNLPYLRNIDSYAFGRQMESIVENNGRLPPRDDLYQAPDGVEIVPAGQNFYIYSGAYSYMFFRLIFPQTSLWEFLIWFPAILASLMAIPMYFIGKLLYDKRAGVLAATFVVFDFSVMARSLGGDPDSDAIVLLIPLVVISLFLFTYKYIQKNNIDKRSLLYSIVTGLMLAVWSYTWGGYWFVIWMITGFTILIIIHEYVKKHSQKRIWSNIKPHVLSFFLIIFVWMLFTLPFIGLGFLAGTFLGPIGFSEIKEEKGEFPNVYVSVAELQNPGDARQIIQRTSPIQLDSNPLAMLISPFFLMVYSLLYLIFSYFKTGKHIETLVLLGIWFVGPFLATILAVRFSILFSAPIAIGAAIFLAKILRLSLGEDKRVAD